MALFENCESVAIAPQERYGDGPSTIDLTQDAEYGSPSFVWVADYGQFAPNLPERSSVPPLGRAPIEALCRNNQLRIALPCVSASTCGPPTARAAAATRIVRASTGVMAPPAVGASSAANGVVS